MHQLLQHSRKRLVFEEVPKRTKTHILASLLFLSYGFPTGALPQDDGSASSKVGKDQKIEVHARLSQDAVRPDSSIAAALILNIQAGWHINTANPSDETMIATSADVISPSGVEVVSISYPHGIQRKFAFSENAIEVYEGTQILYLKLHITPETPFGRIQLPIDISYQACNNVLCLAPATRRVIVDINVVPPLAPVSKTNQELFRGMINH